MSKDNNRAFGNRPKRQSEEGYDVVSTSLPEDRFQGEKQVLNPDQLGGADSPVTGSVSGAQTARDAAIRLRSKLRVAPDASVEVLDKKQVGGVPLEGGYASRSMAGFSGMSAADDTSKIPYQSGNYRPNTRYGKKRSEDLFELDNTVCEQVVPVVDDALDLREAPEAKQGYNGRKQFKQVRSKKNFVGDVRSLLYNASTDIEMHHFDIATSGQMLDGIDPQADYPTRAYGAGSSSGSIVTNPMKKGNYVLKSFIITIDNVHKRIKGFEFKEDRVIARADDLTRDEANLNWQVDGNRVAKSMIRMQTELGRETTEKWSPLAYVIDQPYEYNMLCHDIEAQTGAIMATAYRASVSSLSYQRNLVNKDGIAPQSAAIRMFLEDFAGLMVEGSALGSTSVQDLVFNGDFYRAGSAASLIEMFDSISKYRTKADILGLQRSLSLHLSQADNNINPLRCKPEFLQILDRAHIFSTVSGKYNPLLPIHVTKGIRLVSPLSLNFFAQGWKHPIADAEEIAADPNYNPEIGTYAKYGYKYSDLRNSYRTRVQHPIVEGLISWVLRHEGAFVKTFTKGVSAQDEVTVTIPCTFDFTNPGLFEFMLCSASQYIAFQRNIIFRDILFAGEQSTYIWDDLTSLKDSDPLHSTQLTIKGYNEDLILGKLHNAIALRTMWGEQTPLIKESTAGVDRHHMIYAMPWHFNEEQFTTEYTASRGFKKADHPYNMSIPSIRDEVRHEYVDLIKSMDEVDVRLSLDRMLDIPRFVSVENGAYCDKVITPDFTTASNAHITLRAVRYDKNSDGRVLVDYELADGIAGSQRIIPEISLLCVPKELGWIWDSPVSVITLVTGVAADGTISLKQKRSAYTDNFSGGSSCVIRSYRVKSNAFTDGSIDRSAALSQDYITAVASREYADVNAAFTAKTGVALSASYDSDGSEETDCIYSLHGDLNPIYASGSSGTTVLSGFTSRAKVVWSMIQRFFKPVNPFENCYLSMSDADVDITDPLEYSFYWGLCGTLASDYTQHVLERLDTFDQLNLDYVEDVFTKESLLFRS